MEGWLTKLQIISDYSESCVDSAAAYGEVMVDSFARKLDWLEIPKDIKLSK